MGSEETEPRKRLSGSLLTEAGRGEEERGKNRQKHENSSINERERETGQKPDANKPSMRDRVQGSVLGMCVGDALAAPLHWYYDLSKMEEHIAEAYGHVHDKEGRLCTYASVAQGIEHPGAFAYPISAKSRQPCGPGVCTILISLHSCLILLPFKSFSFLHLCKLQSSCPSACLPVHLSVCRSVSTSED